MNGEEKIKKNSQFRYIYAHGKSYSDENLVLYVLKNRKNINRTGISISKKVGNSVVRNKIKRLIRENYRLCKDDIKKGYDLIFIVRINAANADYYKIRKSMYYLFKKTNLLNKV